MPNSPHSSNASASFRSDWRPSAVLRGALIALGLLGGLSLLASDLPRAFTLTDEMAMSPAATISKAGKVVIEARVSKSGEVKPQAGDLAGTSAPVAPGATDVRVTIDRVVP